MIKNEAFRRLILVAFAFVAVHSLKAQHKLDEYIKEGLTSNQRIKQQQIDLQKSEVLLYKRELVKEIKTAYYKYIKAIHAIKIYESSLRLVEEGQRINTALFNNSKVNRTAVIRSNNEVSKINAS